MNISLSRIFHDAVNSPFVLTLALGGLVTGMIVTAAPMVQTAIDERQPLPYLCNSDDDTMTAYVSESGPGFAMLATKNTKNILYTDNVRAKPDLIQAARKFCAGKIHKFLLSDEFAQDGYYSCKGPFGIAVADAIDERHTRLLLDDGKVKITSDLSFPLMQKSANSYCVTGALIK